MNKLQKLPTDRNVFVSLNPPFEPKNSSLKKELIYEHPVFDSAMVKARNELKEYQGKNGFWFCGAWDGHGFHEDGFISGKKVAKEINRNN